MSQWVIVETDDAVHVVPDEDVVEHDADSLDCICGPAVSFEEERHLVVHNALDGREHQEPDHDVLDCPLCSSGVA